MSMLRKLVSVLLLVCALALSVVAAIEHPHPPPNDHFTNAITLVGASGRIDGTLAGATLEPGETTRPTVWYKWTAPSDIKLVFRYILREGAALMADVFADTHWTNQPPVSNGGHMTATRNTTYYIRVACCNQFTCCGADFTLVWGNLFVPGDFWTDSIPFIGHRGSITATTANASQQLDEPPLFRGGHSIWFQWLAPMSGNATIDFAGTDFDTVSGAWSDLTAAPLATNDNATASNMWSRLTFPVDAGRYYFVGLDSVSGETGNVVLNWSLELDGRLPDLTIRAAGPHIQTINTPGEDCSSCPVGSGTRRLLRFGARSRNEGNADLYLNGLPELLPIEYHPCHEHYHLLGYADYRLVDTNYAPVATSRKISFCLEDSNRWHPDASLSQRYDCQFQGIQVGWEDSYPAELHCQWIDVTGVPPGQYFLELEVDPGNQIPELNESNNVQRTPLSFPEGGGTYFNDRWLSATRIEGLSGEWNGQNGGAARENGEPILAGGHSVWYRWTAPSNGLVTFDTIGSANGAVIGVYSGEAVEALTPVAPGATTNVLQFAAVAGVDYTIMIDSPVGQTGAFEFHWWLGPTPNDHFANAWPFGLAPDLFLRLSTVHASSEPAEPRHAGYAPGRSVWYYWTAPFSRHATFTTWNSDFDTVLVVYTGDSLAKLQEVASNDNDGTNRYSTVEIDLIEGTTYYFAVDGVDGDWGRVQLGMHIARVPATMSITRGSNDSVQITLDADENRPFAIEGSSDLTNWIRIVSGETKDGRIRVAETLPAGSSTRFYRARKLPEGD